MKLRNKKTGEIGGLLGLKVSAGIIWLNIEFQGREPKAYCYNSLAELNDEWKDYKPVEPIFDEKIRRGIRAWWDMQDNPFKSARVMLKSRDKDLDGFYHWRIFAYIRNGEERISTDMEFRTKNLYDYNSSHDYTKEELCGEEGE